MSTETTICVRARWVLADDEGSPRLLENRWVVVEGNRVAAIATDRPLGAGQVIDRPDLLVLPGLMNLHNHCFTELLARGRSEDLERGAFETRLIYGLLMPLGQLALDILSPEEKRAIIALGLLQIIKGGATTLMDCFRRQLADFFPVAEAMGLRFYGVPYVFSTAGLDIDADGRPNYTADPGGGNGELAEWRALFDAYDGAANGRLRVALGPHGTDTCGPDLLREVRRVADEIGCNVTTHVAQSEVELQVIAERYGGRSPVEYLDWVGLLGPDLLAAHCIHSPATDLETLRRTGTTVINCTRTFSRGAVPAPFSRFSSHGLRTVIGTDGYNMDLITELGAAGLVAKMEARDSGVATARDLIRAVTTDAAAAVRRPDLGRLAPGATADLVAFDLGRAPLQPVSDPLQALVWRGSGADLWLSIVDGRILVGEGVYQLADAAAIVDAGAAAVRKIWEHPSAARYVTRHEPGVVGGPYAHP